MFRQIINHTNHDRSTIWWNVSNSVRCGWNCPFKEWKWVKLFTFFEYLPLNVWVQRSRIKTEFVEKFIWTHKKWKTQRKMLFCRIKSLKKESDLIETQLITCDILWWWIIIQKHNSPWPFHITSLASIKKYNKKITKFSKNIKLFSFTTP